MLDAVVTDMEKTNMRIVLIIITLLFTWVDSHAQADEPVSVEIVKEIQMLKDDIYNNTLLWMAESFRSSKAVIDLKDRELGTIVGNGVVDIKIGWGVYTPARFKLKIDIKDNKYRLTFINVIMIFDGKEKPIEVANRKSLEPKVTTKFTEIAARLHEYLGKAGSSKNW